MKVIVILTTVFCAYTVEGVTKRSCGVDSDNSSVVYEGTVPASTYPWLGLLYYPAAKKRFSTVVVLVTKQIVIAAASDLDILPKLDFRSKAKVVLGHKCGENEIDVRDYSYHPDFDDNRRSALAMVQLEIDHYTAGTLQPICAPPLHLVEPRFYSMVLTDGCRHPKITVKEMINVNREKCKHFYRRNGLDQASVWPAHTACARARFGGPCVWRSGAVLTVKQDHRWLLLGISIHGPGCGAPARFIDYGQYHRWVRRSISSMGRPAVTRIADNHLIMRRTSSNVQRFGPCDPEEMKQELFRDKMAVIFRIDDYRARYNLTLLESMEYSCITFKASPLEKQDFVRLEIDNPGPFTDISKVCPKIPKIRLRRWCMTPSGMCYSFQLLEIQFYVEIIFSRSVQFQVVAYGKEAKIIAANLAMKFANRHITRPHIFKVSEIQKLLKAQKVSHLWFHLDDIRNSKPFKDRISSQSKTNGTGGSRRRVIVNRYSTTKDDN